MRAIFPGHHVRCYFGLTKTRKGVVQNGEWSINVERKGQKRMMDAGRNDLEGAGNKSNPEGMIV